MAPHIEVMLTLNSLVSITSKLHRKPQIMVEKNCLPDVLVGSIRTTHMQADTLDWDDTCTWHSLSSYITNKSWHNLDLNKIDSQVESALSAWPHCELTQTTLHFYHEHVRELHIIRGIQAFNASRSEPSWPVLLLLDWGSNIGAHHNDSSHPPCLLPPDTTEGFIHLT